jgi:hypothetical protein
LLLVVAAESPYPGHDDPLGIRARFALACRDLTVPELASVLGVKEDDARHFQAGEEPIPLEVVVRVCHARGISRLWMLAGLGPKEAPLPPKEPPKR